MFVVSFGTIREGFAFFGPFATTEEAEEWAETGEKYHDGDWCVVSLQEPEER